MVQWISAFSLVVILPSMLAEDNSLIKNVVVKVKDYVEVIEGYQTTTQELQSTVEQLKNTITILNQTNHEQAARIETLEANVEAMNTSLGECICIFHIASAEYICQKTCRNIDYFLFCRGCGLPCPDVPSAIIDCSGDSCLWHCHLQWRKWVSSVTHSNRREM